MSKSIHIQLQDIDGRTWHYDTIGPEGVGEWLADIVPKLSKEFNNLGGNATIRVFEPAK